MKSKVELTMDEHNDLPLNRIPRYVPTVRKQGENALAYIKSVVTASQF